MHHAPEWSHEAAFAAEPANVSEVRDFVATHLVAHDLTGLVPDVLLVVSELATNAMAHARTPFAVTLSQLDGKVLVAIRDSSSGVPLRAAPQVMDLNGRGLMLVELLSREWGVDVEGPGSKSVWASFDARTTPGAAPVGA